MNTRWLSHVRQHLMRGIDSRDLAVPGVWLLVCALPIGALLGVTGEMDAGTFLLVLLAGGLLGTSWVLLHNLASSTDKATKATGGRHETLYGPVGPSHPGTGTGTSVSPRARRFSDAGRATAVQREDYAQDLLAKVARSRGLHQPFYHYGL